MTSDAARPAARVRAHVSGEIFADLRKLTFRNPKPFHRYWIVKCFVRFGDTLMHSLGAAMRLSGEPKEQEARRSALTWQIVQERRYEPMHRRWMDRRPGERHGAQFHSANDQTTDRC